jgi:hypothetical protein
VAFALERAPVEMASEAAAWMSADSPTLSSLVAYRAFAAWTRLHRPDHLMARLRKYLVSDCVLLRGGWLGARLVDVDL